LNLKSVQVDASNLFKWMHQHTHKKWKTKCILFFVFFYFFFCGWNYHLVENMVFWDVHVVDLLISKLAWVCFVNFVLDIVIVYMVVFFKKKVFKKTCKCCFKRRGLRMCLFKTIKR
jgi:ABC-type multidrug transport system permease subunit